MKEQKPTVGRGDLEILDTVEQNENGVLGNSTPALLSPEFPVLPAAMHKQGILQSPPRLGMRFFAYHTQRTLPTVWKITHP